MSSSIFSDFSYNSMLGLPNLCVLVCLLCSGEFYFADGQRISVFHLCWYSIITRSCPTCVVVCRTHRVWCCSVAVAGAFEYPKKKIWKWQ